MKFWTCVEPRTKEPWIALATVASVAASHSPSAPPRRHRSSKVELSIAMKSFRRVSCACMKAMMARVCVCMSAGTRSIWRQLTISKVKLLTGAGRSGTYV